MTEPPTNLPSNSKVNYQSPPPSEQPALSQGEEKTEPTEKVAPVVSGEVVRRKKPLGRKFAETFLSGDAPKTVLGYVAHQVLIPALRDMVADAGREMIDRAIYGGERTTRRTNYRSSRGESVINYNGVSTQSRRSDDRPERPLSRRARQMHDFQQIIIPSRAEADEIVRLMYDRLKRFNEVTVSYLYQLLDISSTYVDEDWGWTDLRGTDVHRVREGYLLDLPDPEPLK